MFYCKPCAVKSDWPDSIIKSFGPCECCDKVTECNDVPSKYLPNPKKQAPKLDVDSIT